MTQQHFESAKTETNPLGWDHIADEGGSLMAIFCEEWIDPAEFRLLSWQLSTQEDPSGLGDLIEDDWEPGITYEQPPEWWGVPEPGREKMYHQRGAIRHTWGRRVPWPDAYPDEDFTDGQFVWHLEISTTEPLANEEGWFKMTYLDLD